MENPLWLDNSIQFPRLISEIFSTVELTTKDFEDICESMDLEKEELNDLIDRALDEWERIKSNV